MEEMKFLQQVDLEVVVVQTETVQPSEVPVVVVDILEGEHHMVKNLPLQ